MKTEDRDQNVGRHSMAACCGKIARILCGPTIGLKNVGGRAAILLSAFCILHSAFSSDPVTAAITNLYGEAESYVSQAEYFWNTDLLLTNCKAYAGASTSSSPQNLTGRTLQLKIGTTSSNVSYTAYAADPSNGLWWARISIPTNWLLPNLQLTIDPTNNPVIYPWKILKTKQPL